MLSKIPRIIVSVAGFAIGYKTISVITQRQTKLNELEKARLTLLKNLEHLDTPEFE